MPKKKNAMALFEAISKSKAKRSEDMTVPGWIGKNQAASVNAGGQVGTAPAAAPPPMPGERSAAPVGGQSVWPADADSQDIVTVSMTRKMAVLIVLCVVLVAAGIFALGMRFGRPGVTNAGIAAGPGATGDEQKPLPPPTDFAPGKYYVVIEELDGFSDKEQADAASIAKFCTENGAPAKVVKFTAGGTKKPRAAILSLRPHDTSKVDDAVKAEAQALEDLGKKYFKLHKDYQLSQHDRKGQLTTWLQLIQ